MKRSAALPMLDWRRSGLLRRSLRLLFWVALPIVIFLALRAIPLPEIWAILRGLEVWQITALIAANLLITLLFSSRWWLILRATGWHVP